ncbi:DNA-directed RNA polymerases II, IV and V subunit 3-like [Pyrus ussuriensis x Pyrus communis]|uniref:DNA-directed RNA polymerases II, IV and V subunit 3-like n=1 Tax=Pyrus ussuriensis x Pyrus communis TaxID=2448454 RepID=A0A5N5H336_9ROSA|nr:DNA-directed RNA polymerases II, IV and V subunit 3-like [Pyrus ussuriensis x Pyrus communis]
MLKANPSFCILGHFIIIGVCFGINIKVSRRTIISPSLILKRQSIHQLFIDSNDGFNHEISNGPQPQYLPLNFPFHRGLSAHT